MRLADAEGARTMTAGMLFPGQGSQFIGMGKDYYDAFAEARELYLAANDALGFDITALSFSGDMEELTRTKNAQPAILLHSLVVMRVLETRGVRPGVVAGHSLGEFSTHVKMDIGDYTCYNVCRAGRKWGYFLVSRSIAFGLIVSALPSRM
jgi:[acyl-carrier-protein] S-malonyltransferase